MRIRQSLLYVIKSGIFPVLIVLPLLSAGRKEGNSDFNIVSCKKRTIYGGVEGSPVTTTFDLILKAKKKFTLKTDSVWAMGRAEIADIYKDTITMTDTPVKQIRLKKGQIIRLRFNIKVNQDQGRKNFPEAMEVSRESPFPVNCPAEAMLRYKGGKSKYLIINKIITLPPIYAP